MTKYNPEIVLTKEVADIIRWFTMNYDNEIGALGRAEFIDGRFVVDKLYFPKQKVTPSHVSFTPADWPLAEIGDDHGKICFYWHKHPEGSASPSTDDEENSFKALMPEDTEKKYHGFLITAPNNTKTDMVYYARIDLREPLWATIENCSLHIEDESGVEEYCQNILTEKVTIGYQHNTNKTTNYFDKPNAYKYPYTTPALTPLNNDKTDKDVLEVKQKNGIVSVTTNNERVQEMFKYDMDDIVQTITNIKHPNGLLEYSLKPKKKKLSETLERISAIKLLTEEEKLWGNTSLYNKESSYNENPLYDAEYDYKKHHRWY